MRFLTANNYWFLALCTAMLLTVGFQQTGIGLDSAIYASVARNVAEEGDWLNPSFTEFYHTPFAEHPPLLFWLQALVFLAIGASDATARVVSVLCGIGSVLLVYSIGRRMVEEHFGLLVALVLMLTVNFLSLSFKTFIEPLFFLLILISLYGLVCATQGKPAVGYLLFGAGLGLAALAKGVVVVGYLVGGAVWLALYRRELLAERGFWLGLLLAAALPIAYLALEAKLGKNYFLQYYFQRKIIRHNLQAHSQAGPLAYVYGGLKLYWPWLPLWLAGLFYAFKRTNAWLKLVALICLSYTVFHSLAARVLWQYYANLYIFGAFLSAFTWRQFPRLRFDPARFKLVFLGVVMVLFVIAQMLPIRVHEQRDQTLLSFTPYAEHVLQNRPRRLLFTQQAFGIWSAPAKFKWYWRADAKHVLNLSHLRRELEGDGRFAGVFVHTSQLDSLRCDPTAIVLQPLAKCDEVVMLVPPPITLPSRDSLDVRFPSQFFR